MVAYFFWWPLLPLTNLNPTNFAYVLQAKLTDFKIFLRMLQKMSDDDLILIASDPQPCSKLIDCFGLYNSQVKILAAKEAEARAKKIETQFKEKDQQLKEQQLLVSARSADSTWWATLWQGFLAGAAVATIFFAICKFVLRLRKKPVVAAANEQKTSETVPLEDPSLKQGPPPLG